jgi:hypothetical protein
VTTPNEELHTHDGPVEVRVSWWLIVGVGAMLGVGLAWFATREQSHVLDAVLADKMLEDLRIRELVRQEITQFVNEANELMNSSLDEAKSDEDKVL